MVNVVSIVGMPGAGKSVVSRIFEECGYFRVRFGDITEEEINRRGLKINEKNERYIRELLRKEHGMAAYAKLSLPRINTARQSSPVVIDGMYSWEEYTLLKATFGGDYYTVAVWSSPNTRYTRLGVRSNRPLTPVEAATRDRSEIENLNKGGPIAMADFTLVNETSLADLDKQSRKVITELK